MKLKPLLFISLIALTFACSKDDSNNNDDDSAQDGILIKQINYNPVNVEDDDPYTETFNYDGNKLLSIIDTFIASDNEYSATFDYDDGKIVRIDFFDNGELEEYVTLMYNEDGNLASFNTFFKLEDDQGNLVEIPSKFVLVYNDNNSNLVLDRYYGDISDQAQDPDMINLIINDGNILEIDDSEDEFNEKDVLSFEYDTKNSVYKNISDFEIITLIMNFTEYGFEILGATNNVTKFTIEQGGFYNAETTEYTYNSNDYPETAIVYYDGELDANVEYIYE